MWHSTTIPNWIAAHRSRRTVLPPPLLPAPVLPIPAVPLVRPNLAQLAQLPPEELPDFVRHCPVAMKYLALFGPLDWTHFPERPGGRAWPGHKPAPRAPFAAAFLVKVEEDHRHLSQLRTYLADHPALVWILGFPLKPDPTKPWGFDAEASLPSRKHLGRVLRELPNEALQFLLRATVHLLHDALPADAPFGDVISLDTKHIIAWVKENNPKVYVKDRFDKTCQPKGDPDCKLGCKRKENQHKGKSAKASAQSAPAAAPTPPAPTTEGQPASQTLAPLAKGEYYWGYASGVVATKVTDSSGDALAEVVLAEFTQTFDHADQSYFHPLMTQTEGTLGHAPRFGALDAAFDCFYVYEYFHDAGGFAAVPWADRSDHKKTFSPEGLPLCAAGLPMPLRSTFFQQSFCLVPHTVGRYACPLLYPAHTGESCPLQHANWEKGGCITSLPTSSGNRIRHELDRQSADFKAIYQQRTAVERINSQALALGIERPHLRNGRAIANINTLIYVLINLRTLQRIREHQPQAGGGDRAERLSAGG